MIADDESDTSTYSLHCFHRKRIGTTKDGATRRCRGSLPPPQVIQSKSLMCRIFRSRGLPRASSSPQAYKKLFTF